MLEQFPVHSSLQQVIKPGEPEISARKISILRTARPHVQMTSHSISRSKMSIFSKASLKKVLARLQRNFQGKQFRGDREKERVQSQSDVETDISWT